MLCFRLATCLSQITGETPENAPYGIFSGNHFGNFLDLRPLRSESSKSTSEIHPGTSQESSEVLSSGFGPSVFYPQQSAFVGKLLDRVGQEDTQPFPVRQDLNQYPSGSVYDKYMTQLSSRSTDTQPYIIWTPPVNSSEVPDRMFSVMNENTGESSLSFSSYVNPCRINLDYFDCMWNEEKDLGHQTTDKHQENWSNSVGNMATVGNLSLNSLGADRLVGECLENGRPVQESSELKYDWGSVNSSEAGLVHRHDFSSELLDVNNPSVDSPCWKGTPVPYWPSSDTMKKTDAPHPIKGTCGFNSSDQIEKDPELISKYKELLCKQKKALPSESDPLRTMKFPFTRKNSEYHEEIPPVSVKVHNVMGRYASSLPEEEHPRRQEYYDYGIDSKDVITPSQQESPFPPSKAKPLGEHNANHIGSITKESINKATSPFCSAPSIPVESLTGESVQGNISTLTAKEEESTESPMFVKGGQEHSHCYPGAEGNMSCESSSKTPAIFLKQMHNLSVMLLSTCNGGSSLQEYEQELVQSVIQNLRVASFNRNKVEDISSMRNNFWMATPEQSAPENNSELKTSISQDLTKLLEDGMVDGGDVSQLLIYKKLWIEAEASACKLKYELELARAKLATMKGHTNTHKVPVDSSKDNKASSSTISNSKPLNYAKENIASPVSMQCQSGDSVDRQSPAVDRSFVSDVDADMFPQLDVLLSGVSNVSFFCEKNSKKPQEAGKKPYVVEDAVMARLRVLKSRPDNKTSLGQEDDKHQLDATTNSADGIEDAVMARLRVLKSHPDNKTSLGQEVNKHQLDATANSADGVDNVSSFCENSTKEQQEASKKPCPVEDAVMARLRILNSRPDNMSSLGQESNKHQLDASMNRADGIDDAVMARLKILKSRPDNITSLGRDASTCKEYEIDDPVLSRLRILKCRSASTNSSVHVSKQDEEACNDQSYWDGYGATAEIQVPRGGMGNSTSIAEECPNLLHSDNFANHSEGKDSIGGLESFGDATNSNENDGSAGTADAAIPNRCKAPSDEVNVKSAVQCEDGFAMNHDVSHTARDSNICTAGSQEAPLISSSFHQYDGFLPEWEHVLKENFFPPGK